MNIKPTMAPPTPELMSSIRSRNSGGTAPAASRIPLGHPPLYRCHEQLHGDGHDHVHEGADDPREKPTHRSVLEGDRHGMALLHQVGRNNAASHDSRGNRRGCRPR